MLRSSGCPIFFPIAEAEPRKKVASIFVAREIVLPINCLTIWPPLGGRINRPSASGRKIDRDCCCDCEINSLVNYCDCEINSSPGFMAISADKPRRPNNRGGGRRERALAGVEWHTLFFSSFFFQYFFFIKKFKYWRFSTRKLGFNCLSPCLKEKIFCLEQMWQEKLQNKTHIYKRKYIQIWFLFKLWL